MRATVVAMAASAAAMAALFCAVLAMEIRRRADPDRKAARLRQAVIAAMERISVHAKWEKSRSCIVLSGGLDSGIIAEAGREVLGVTGAVTLLCTDEDASDRPYAVASARAAGLKHTVVEVKVLELLQKELPTCVRVLRSFDPMTLRNEIAVCAALRAAVAAGYTCAVTGDGADELLGGYSFTHGMTDQAWVKNRAEMASQMTFGSGPLGAHLGLWVAQPYCDHRVVRCAKGFGKPECVGIPKEVATAAGQANCDGLEAAGRTMGKLPLRRAFPEVTSCWRSKDPIEVGCGTTALSRPGFFDDLISDDEWAHQADTALHRHGVRLRDKEHLFYYQVFRQVFPNGAMPGVERHGSDPCPACGYQMRERTGCFCHTCGHFDPQLRG